MGQTRADYVPQVRQADGFTIIVQIFILCSSSVGVYGLADGRQLSGNAGNVMRIFISLIVVYHKEGKGVFKKMSDEENSYYFLNNIGWMKFNLPTPKYFETYECVH